MHESDRPAVFVVRRQETYRSWDACRFRVRFVIHMWIIHSIFLYSLVKKTYYFSTTTRSFSPRLSYWIKEMDYWVWDWLDRKVPWLLCRAWTNRLPSSSQINRLNNRSCVVAPFSWKGTSRPLEHMPTTRLPFLKWRNLSLDARTLDR